MEFEATKDLFKRHMEKMAKTCRMKGLLGFALCPAALAVAVARVYGLLRLFTYKKVSFEEIQAELPWLDLELVLPQIRSAIHQCAQPLPSIA